MQKKLTHGETFESKLLSLNTTQASIQTLAEWVLFHEAKYKESVETWAASFQRAPPPRKLDHLYLCNDIVQKSRSRTWKFISEFAKVLPSLLQAMVRNCPQKCIKEMERILGIWELRQIYSKETLDAWRQTIYPKKSVPEPAPPLPSPVSAPAAIPASTVSAPAKTIKRKKIIKKAPANRPPMATEPPPLENPDVPSESVPTTEETEKEQSVVTIAPATTISTTTSTQTTSTSATTTTAVAAATATATTTTAPAVTDGVAGEVAVVMLFDRLVRLVTDIEEANVELHNAMQGQGSLSAIDKRKHLSAQIDRRTSLVELLKSIMAEEVRKLESDRVEVNSLDSPEEDHVDKKRKVTNLPDGEGVAQHVEENGGENGGANGGENGGENGGVNGGVVSEEATIATTTAWNPIPMHRARSIQEL